LVSRGFLVDGISKVRYFAAQSIFSAHHLTI